MKSTVPAPQPVAAPAVSEKGKPAFLSVESSPPGAQIFIDGTLKGMSPAHIELSAGKHEVRLNLPHHYDWEAQVDLKEETDTPLAVTLISINAK